MRSRLILVRLRLYFWLLKVLKVKFLIKIDLNNLKGAFAHDNTELPNYNFKKSLYLSSPKPESFFNENYGSSYCSSKIWRLHGSGSATLLRRKYTPVMIRDREIILPFIVLSIYLSLLFRLVQKRGCSMRDTQGARYSRAGLI